MRAKLWLAGTMLAVFLATMVIGNQFIPADKAVERKMLGHDFTAFYSAGHFAAQRQFDKLYDVQAIKDFEQETGRRFGLSLGDSYGPYWNPPFYAWVFAPLSYLSYPNALLVWTLFNVACGLGAIVLLCRMLGALDWKTWGLVPLLLICSMPVLQALSHGQNTMISLLLLTATVTFWRGSSPIRAGLVAGLLFYKPQLGAIVAAALVVTLGWRALVGLAITGTILLLITITTMPGMLTAFFTQLPVNLRFMQIDHAYVWERHATIKAFWRLLFQGRGAGEASLIVNALTGVCVLALATGLVIAVKRSKRVTSDGLIAATIATMPLLMPFYFDYDLMLLAIPAVLFAAEQAKKPHSADSVADVLAEGVLQLPRRFNWAAIPPAQANAASSQSSVLSPQSCPDPDRWLTRAWVALYLWTLVNPGLAGQSRINLTVPLLAVVASLLIARTIRQHPVEVDPNRFKRNVRVDNSRGRPPRVRLTGAAAHG